MKRRIAFALPAVTALSLIAGLGTAHAQQKSLKEQIVGTWRLVSYESITADGTRNAVLGAQANGLLMLDAGGNFTFVLTDQLRPKWKPGNRNQTTSEEYVSAAKGLSAQYGRWAVDEATKTWERSVEGALNPGLAGTTQKFAVSVSADQLKISDADSGHTGTKTEIIYKKIN